MAEGKIEQIDLHTVVSKRLEKSTSIPETFFAAEAEQIAQACWAMARRFHRGGRLLAFGTGASATDAQHVAVEFIHPVIVGKRALLALALTNDSATLSSLMSGKQAEAPFVRELSVLARSQDIAMGFAPDENCPHILAALEFARSRGLLTLALLGGNVGQLSKSATAHECVADFCFVVSADDALAIQETQETLYHVLWELVHIFFEHEGLLHEE
jgi:D-sedoheptulose 7-phosphate isomerase